MTTRVPLQVGAMPERIALIGLMGAGKTAAGRELADRLERRFVDLDAEIEARAGRSIPEIFAEHGEARFRLLEREALAAALAREEPQVLALGGGAVTEPLVRELLREHGVAAAWLEAPAEVLAARTAAPGRPLLAGLDASGRVERLRALLEARAASYAEAASIRVPAGDRLPEEVVDDLLGALAGARRVPVPLADGRAYDVVVEAGALQRLGAHLRACGCKPGPVALITCRNVVARYGEAALEALGDAGYRPVLLTLPPGEGAKRLDEVERACQHLASAGLERSSAVVGLGGGALTDVAGLVAALYRRGVPWIACPTTLLGMVDAAIGGKTAVNLPSGKNLVGAFHQPRLVLADVRTLGTLEAREARSGLGEIAKYALLAPSSSGFLPWLETRLARLLDARGRLAPGAQHLLIEVVARSAALKAEVVAADEREETGRRKVLNLGHTIGHAIEAAAGFGAIAHGEAVVHGLRAMLALSKAKGLLRADERDHLLAFLARLPIPPLGREPTTDRILGYLAQDKKFEGGRRLFVLLEGAGRPVVDIEVEHDEIERAIASIR